MSAALSNRPRLKLPSSAKAGEIIEIRTLLDHPMETGLRRTPDGQPIARDMLTRFQADANGANFFQVDFRNATSANPYLVFCARVTVPTEFRFTWTHEDGRSVSATAFVAAT